MLFSTRVITGLAAACLGLSSAAALAGDYSSNPAALAMVKRLVKNDGFTRSQVMQILDDAERIPELIPKETHSAERVQPWYEYRDQFVHPYRVKKGVEFMREHAASLQRATKRWGVPANIITAIIGVETNYGNFTGKIRVLDSLATQAFDHPTRGAFFSHELEKFFVLCRSFGLNATAVTGSYAGAMGMAQFMPSNYLTLAVDFNADGKLDLWNAEDAIGSIANYLVHYRGSNFGWNRGQPVVFPARAHFNGTTTPQMNTKKVNYQLGQLEQMGVQLRTQQAQPASSTPVGLLQLKGRNGPKYWVALDNFYAIMSYNPRTKYALAVYELATAIDKARAQHAQ